MYATDRLPHPGGVTATMVVTIPVETLLDGLAPGVLDTGTDHHDQAARREDRRHQEDMDRPSSARHHTRRPPTTRQPDADRHHAP